MLKPILVLSLAILPSFSAFADCAGRAEQAAIHEASGGRANDPASSIAWEASAELVQETSGLLLYEVEVYSSSSDGASSSEFPVEKYQVSAKGSEDKCRVFKVKAI